MKVIDHQKTYRMKPISSNFATNFSSPLITRPHRVQHQFMDNLTESIGFRLFAPPRSDMLH